MNDNLLEQIIQIIDNKDFSKFIGLKEDTCFEAKREVYNIKDARDRIELAKDVSALANYEGGYLIIGLNDEPIATEHRNRIASLNLIRKESFCIKEYEGVIKEYIYPLLDNIKVDWVGEKSDPNQGIGYIFIPNQKEINKYFLIKKVFEHDKKIKQIVFGIAIRSKTDNNPFSVNDLHRFLNKGRKSESTSERIDRLENKIDSIILSLTEKKSSSFKDKLLIRTKSIIND